MLRHENSDKEHKLEHTFHKDDIVKMTEDVFVSYMNLVKGTELTIVEALDNNEYKVKTDSGRFVKVSGDSLEKI